MINIFFTLLMLLALLATACSKQDDAGVRATITPGNNSALQLAATTPSATAVAVEDVPMITIPAGEFIMGSTREDVIRWNNAWNENADKYQQGFPGIFRNEMPQLRVYLDTFEIDQVEVTNGHYQVCVIAGSCAESGRGNDIRYDDPKRVNYPVVIVTHEQAETYCEWLGKRLPTEAEWEKAARGTDGRIYPWGNEWNPANLNMEWSNRPVGSVTESASPYGVLDMVGGVSEWVAESELIPYSEENQSVVDQNNYSWVYRGGSISSPFIAELQMRISARTKSPIPYEKVGFRCASGSQPLSLNRIVVEVFNPTPIPVPAQVDLSGMVLVSAGEFIMGTDNPPDDSFRSSAPAHTVYLDDFYIDKYEVTWEQFATFLNTLGEYRFACGEQDCLAYYHGYGSDDLPSYVIHIRRVEDTFYPPDGFENAAVAMATWYGAQAYCQSQGKTLPTEAQWEKAIRGTDGWLYPWGNEWISYDVFARYDDVADGDNDPVAVGSYPIDVSPYGIYDMFGDPREWVADWFREDYYAHSPYENPSGPESPDAELSKVYRPWLPTLYGSIVKGYGSPSRGGFGFRCVYTP